MVRRIVFFLLIVSFFPNLVSGQENSYAPPPPALPSLLKTGEGVTGTPAMPASGTAGRSFMSQGQAYLESGRVTEAKEALRTAIRLEPMNLEAWALYDYAVETSYLGRARDEKIHPSMEYAYKPNFSIERVESYMEFGNLNLVGEVKNVSGELRRHVEITGILTDENGREIRRESTFLTLSDRGIFPGEKRLFEIRFRSPPPGIKSYRVKISNFE